MTATFQLSVDEVLGLDNATPPGYEKFSILPDAPRLAFRNISLMVNPMDRTQWLASPLLATEDRQEEWSFINLPSSNYALKLHYTDHVVVSRTVKGCTLSIDSRPHSIAESPPI